MLRFNPFKSLTLKGALVAVGGYLWAHFDPNALSGNLATVAQAVGAVLTVVGARNAIAKNGTGQ